MEKAILIIAGRTISRMTVSAARTTGCTAGIATTITKTIKKSTHIFTITFFTQKIAFFHFFNRCSYIKNMKAVLTLVFVIRHKRNPFNMKISIVNNDCYIVKIILPYIIIKNKQKCLFV